MRNLTTLPPRQRPTGPLARARRVAAELTPDAIERVAQRVVELLHHQSHAINDDQESPDLLDAGQLARRLGVTRAWVYENAAQLGALPLSDGPRPRLRFDLAIAKQAFQARQCRSESVATREKPQPTRRRRTPTAVPLLPVHEPRTRGILARWQRAQGRNR